VPTPGPQSDSAVKAKNSFQQFKNASNLGPLGTVFEEAEINGHLSPSTMNNGVGPQI